MGTQQEQESSAPVDTDPSAPDSPPAVFPFSTHPLIVDKPAAWDPAFASDWVGRQGSLEDLRHCIRDLGIAFIPVAMRSGHRNSAAFDHASLAVVDVDHGLDIDEFLAHPLAACAAYIYTTANHRPEPGSHRYRVVFRLPRVIDDPAAYKAATTLLVRALGGDRNCTDPCRLFYSFRGCEEPLWQPDACLPGSFLDDVRQEVRQQQLAYNRDTADYDEYDIARAVHVLEQVIPPTCDGERDLFTRVTAAARSAGSVLFPSWADWASRGHHGKGKNSGQASERFFQGFRGSSLATLFHLANDADPEWRSGLPEELRPTGGSSFFMRTGVAGYDHADFLGDVDYLDEGLAPQELAPTTQGLFDASKPWTAPVAPPPEIEASANDDPDPDPEDLEYEATVAAGAPQAPGHQGADQVAQSDPVRRIKDRLLLLYPGLRLNAMSLGLEYGPREHPLKLDDLSTAYVRISAGTGTLFQKATVSDIATVIGFENAYHPVRRYLEHCSSSVTPCPYFDTLATELLGLPNDELQNPTFPDGRRVADVIMERFLVGAVARIVNPGCRHDWMPILIGGQNSGKTTFFQYLTPPDPSDPGHYPWAATIQQGIGYLKERPHALHAGWMVVLDEVERYFQRRYTEELKNLVSVSVDRSARKYENERSFPRSFVLSGTANNGDFLVDPTGNRRFMPVVVRGKVPSPRNPDLLIIDLDRLKADRDSIWAAAYRRYLDNPVHLFSSDELAFMGPYLEGFIADSPADMRVARALETKTSGIYGGCNYVTLSDVFLWLDIPLANQGTMTIPISDALKRLGWKMVRRRIAGEIRRIWLKGDAE